LPISVDTPYQQADEVQGRQYNILPTMLIFHAGQLYAESGNVSKAIKVFAGASRTTYKQWNN